VLTTIPDWIPLTFLPVLAIVAIWLLVKWRRQVERTSRLAVEESRYRNLFENARDILFTLSPEGVIQTINQSIERVSGKRRDEMVGTHFANLAADEEARALFADHLDKVIQHHSPGTTQIRITGQDPTSGAKENRILELSSHGLPETGKVTVIQGMARDVTMRKQLEQSKLKTEQLETISRMSGGIAYDFNNILTIIRGYADQIREDGDDKQMTAEGLEAILAATRHAELLTLQLTGLSWRQLKNPRPLNVHDVIHDTLKDLAPIFPEDISLQESLDAENPIVFAPDGAIEQIILNLALNARDALPNGGSLIFETHRQNLPEDTVIDGVGIGAGPYVVVSVSDDGEGMDEATMARVFEPFFTTKRPGGGSGLGLNSVQSAMARMGGRILVVSSPGRGAQFTLYLPWSDLIPPASQQPVGRPGAGEKVLLVEDNDQVRHVVDRILRASGYDVMTADSVESALSHPDRQFDAVVTELAMTGMTGVELAERIREQNAGIPVLFISGLPPKNDVGNQVPRSRFMQKPLEPKLLALELRALLDDPA
jgi:PAS domain S-box-containing protein